MTTDIEPAPASPAGPAPRWARADGVQLLGAATGSGLVDPTYLIKRGDGQLLQVSELLHLVVQELSPGRDPQDVAEDVSQAYGRRLTPEGLQQLIRRTLCPLGLVADTRAPSEEGVQHPRANPLLSLRFRGTILPERPVNVLSGALRPLFHPAIVAVAVAALVALDVVLLMRGGLLDAVQQVLQVPVLLLGLYALLTLGALVHELGHATACRYGGARPGVIGFGIYIVFPAFFTNVTDAYRLGRSGRLRVDLGGLYFNVLCLLAAGAAYLITGHGLLLLVVVIMQVEMVQQLIPTLRFDGYYVLADLAGVPDLFARVRPVLSGLLPGRPTHPLVSEMKPAARWIVTVWVVTVVPTLLLALVWILASLPLILGTAADSVRQHAALASRAWLDTAAAEFVLAVLSIVLLVLPLLGLTVLLHRLSRMLLLLGRKLAARWLPRRTPPRAVPARPDRQPAQQRPPRGRKPPRPAPRHRTVPLPPRPTPPRHRVWPAPALPLEWPSRNAVPVPGGVSAAARPAGGDPA